MEQAVSERLEHASWLMVCGSLPPGVPASFYGRLIAMARQKKVKTLLDADGEALREGIEASPAWSAQPAGSRAAAGPQLLTRTQYLEAAERIRGMGARIGGALARQPRRHGRFFG